MELVKFGDRLREYRDDRQIKQPELAQRLETSKQTINNWESGKFAPNLNDVPVIAAKLGVSLAWLLGVPGVAMLASEEGKEVDELMQRKIEDQKVMDNAPQQEVNGSMFPVYTEEQLDKRMSMLQQAMDMFSEGKITQEMLELLVRSLR